MLSAKSSAVNGLLEYIDDIPCDRQTIVQERLDLTAKTRSSLLPWRGQFSPELVELFLERYATREAVVLDPFAGSGTTLFEAARKRLESYGADINPSAVEMARTVHFVNATNEERRAVIRSANAIVKAHIYPSQPSLFDYQEYTDIRSTKANAQIADVFPRMLKQSAGQSLTANLLINAFIRYMSYKQQDGADGFLRAFQEHADLVESLPYSERTCNILHSDARCIPLAEGSVDLVITSPPYINVFNYHQNNRPAMEIIGWDLLRVAQSEVGANRKNRQNRFLTVIQYALDMAAALEHIRGLLKASGRAIVVVGRESSVRGVRFGNGRLVAALAVGAAGLSLHSRQERKFKNKFGELIYEDILHFTSATETPMSSEEAARSVAKQILAEGMASANHFVCRDILNALERADNVSQSPIFKPISMY